MPDARCQVPDARCQVGRLAPDTHSFLSFPAFTKPNTTIVRVIIINGDVLIEKYCTEDEANGTNRKHNSRECHDDINVFQPGHISQLWYFNDWRCRQNWSTEADSAVSGIIPNAPFLILPTLNSSSSLSWLFCPLAADNTGEPSYLSINYLHAFAKTNFIVFVCETKELL